MKKIIHFDHELTPVALRLVADVEAREARNVVKAQRLQALKDAALRIEKKTGVKAK